MEEEYIQFAETSLKEIMNLIITTRNELHEYWDKRNKTLCK